MANLDKNIEEKILEIVEKYQKENTKLLNYLITDDEITFFSPIGNGSEMEIVNQEYRFKFKMGI